MSAESLEPKAPLAKSAPKGWGVLAGTLWATLAFLGPQFLIVPLLPLFAALSLSQNTKLFVLQAVIQTMTLAAVVAIIAAYRLDARSIGLGRLKLRYFGWAVAVFPIYLLATTLILGVLGQFLSPEVLEQAQDIAFDSPQGIELALVFLALVVVAPVVEEVIFRGFLYRAYGRRFGMVLGAVLVSVLFGLAHGQINVGIDTFILSLFLCYVRVKTDSLWAPIFLHALKNFVAFYFLFIMGMKL